MFRTPRSVFLSLITWTIVCFALAGLIGQHNDGPWGGLPEWLGSAAWFGFLIGLLATAVTGIYWAVRHSGARHRATP